MVSIFHTNMGSFITSLIKLYPLLSNYKKWINLQTPSQKLDYILWNNLFCRCLCKWMHHTSAYSTTFSYDTKVRAEITQWECILHWAAVTRGGRLLGGQDVIFCGGRRRRGWNGGGERSFDISGFVCSVINGITLVVFRAGNVFQFSWFYISVGEFKVHRRIIWVPPGKLSEKGASYSVILPRNGSVRYTQGLFVFITLGARWLSYIWKSTIT